MESEISESCVMSDSQTTIEELKRSIAGFAEEREWRPFHTLKNLAMSLSIESGELMEHFQWVKGEAAQSLLDNEQTRVAIESELADVAIYVLQFANQAGIDLSDAIRRKMELNAQRYPVEKSRGKSDKYDAL